jgi:hypothetical protein
LEVLHDVEVAEVRYFTEVVIYANDMLVELGEFGGDLDFSVETFDVIGGGEVFRGEDFECAFGFAFELVRAHG